MQPRIRPFEDGDADVVVDLSLRAWEPVFESIERAMDPEVYRRLYPDGWRESQQRSVKEACTRRPDTSNCR